VTFALKLKTHVTSVAMETQQLVLVCTVELDGTVSGIKCSKFLI